ncbi:MAG: HD domain-containing phosphohydrolase [Anaerolineae bacterium]
MSDRAVERILLVDDDPNLLAAIQRQFRRQFGIVTAEGGEAGLDLLRRNGAFAVVVSDMRMPDMNGAEFLRQVRALTPDTVRVMLTGYADLEAAMAAVNEGNIFRFLTKPCPRDVLETTLRACLEQHRLITAERVLLQQTLNGTIKVLMEILSMVSPEAFGRAVRIRRYAGLLAERLEVAGAWQVELAATLSQIGCVTIPPSTIDKIYRGESLLTHEKEMFIRHPETGHNLIKNIPRLEEVARIIAYQEKHYDGAGFPLDEVQGDEIPLGARILKIALDFDMLESAKMAPEKALYTLQKRDGWYDPTILRALADAFDIAYWGEMRAVSLEELTTDMVLAEDVRIEGGTLLLARGQKITEPVLRRLKNVAPYITAREPFRVYMPPDQQDLL